MNDEVRTGGSGVLHHLTDGGSTLSLEDYAIYMIVYSDNTATNVLIDELGMEAINALSRSLGASNTKLQRKMIPTRRVRSWQREPLDPKGRGPDHGADRQVRSADERGLLRPGPGSPGNLQGRADSHANPARDSGSVQARGYHRRGHSMGAGRHA